MLDRSVGLPCEDTVSNAVNAARLIVDALAPEERDRIEVLITVPRQEVGSRTLA